MPWLQWPSAPVALMVPLVRPRPPFWPCLSWCAVAMAGRFSRGSRCQSRWPGPGGPSLLLERTSVSSRHSSRNDASLGTLASCGRGGRRLPAATPNNQNGRGRCGGDCTRLHATATARRPAGGCWRCPLMGRDSNLARRASAQRREQRREHQQTLGRPESPGRRGAYMTRVHQPTSRAVLTQWPQCPYPC